MKRPKSAGFIAGTILLVGATLVAIGAPKYPPETETWLKEARLGPYQEKEFNIPELYEKAKREKEINIYSYSSRVFKFAKTFEKQYPGIKVNGFDMDTSEIVTKVLAEQQARNYVADVVFMKDPATAIHELLERGYIFNYTPQDLEKVLPEKYKRPILINHFGMRVLVYNTESHKEVPVDSLWDLTRPEWKGRVLFPDPIKMPEQIEYLATIVQHSDEMAKEYEREFGKPIKLSPGIKNAGYEWIKRLLENDVIIAGSTNDVSNAVGKAGQKNPPIGITAMSRLRDKEKDPKLVFDVAYNIRPVVGIATPSVIAIPNKAPHPNAAKLLIRWIMGDEKGGQGYKPYFVVGDIPARTDQPNPPKAKAIERRWDVDPDFVWKHGREVMDFWLAHLR